MSEQNFVEINEADMPQLQPQKSNPHKALTKARRPTKAKSKSQILQDFWHACSWRQLKRRAHPTELLQLGRRHYGKLATFVFLGIIISKVEFSTYPNLIQTVDNQPVAQAGFFTNSADNPSPQLVSYSEENAELQLILNRLAEISTEEKRRFLHRFGKVAKSEQEKFGIPASVCLSMAILYSGFGTSELAKNQNNFFHLNCQELKTTETVDYQNECVGKFATAWENFRAHSEFLITNYGDLRETAGKNSELWLLGLERLGYEKAAFSAELLTAIINEYELKRYDK
jgi:flagellum-specific peptidoglycan hydrolase FlgJ